MILDGSSSVNHVVEITNFIKFQSLNGFIFLSIDKLIRGKSDTIALSHSQIDITQNCITGFELGIKLELLYLDLAINPLPALGPAQNDRKFSFLELTNYRYLNFGRHIR